MAGVEDGAEAAGALARAVEVTVGPVVTGVAEAADIAIKEVMVEAIATTKDTETREAIKEEIKVLEGRVARAMVAAVTAITRAATVAVSSRKAATAMPETLVDSTSLNSNSSQTYLLVFYFINLRLGMRTLYAPSF